MEYLKTKGYCPICESESMFVAQEEWLREHYKCIRCNSNPRWRALIEVLQTYFPKWREMSIHESSPGGAASEKIKKECKNYSYSYFFENTEPGAYFKGHRCENLENLTFMNNTFDMIISQDVLEHVFEVDNAFKEINRVLRPGGVHLFTVPFNKHKATEIRAIKDREGINYLKIPQYHGNPINKEGALVVREWGYDICDQILKICGMTTTIVLLNDKQKGIEGNSLEIFISRKSLENNINK